MMAFDACGRWLWPYLTQPRADLDEVTDVLLCICDHFEPLQGASRAEALRRVREWVSGFPKLADRASDADGCPPAHTFFYPLEQYDPEILELLAELCRKAHAEVEVHLHHDRDTAAGLSRTLDAGTQNLRRHGLLSQDASGAVRFGFIHGHCALDDSHPAGRHCGVRNELDVLQAAGCYADFTLPSAPSPTQTRTINRIYYATDTPGAKSHDRGTLMRVGTAAAKGNTVADLRSGPAGLLLVQGPLGLNWGRRRLGILPRLENGELSAAQPPTLARLRLWLELGVRVAGRPEWAVVKLHTHGALPQNAKALLTGAGAAFYGTLPRSLVAGRTLRYHFVTARELVNILHAAEAGYQTNPGIYRDFRYTRGVAVGSPRAGGRSG